MQTPSFDSLAIELLKFGYLPVIFIELDCQCCGSYRLALAAAPDCERYPCPRCNQAVPCSPPLASGFTRRAVPIVEKRRSGLSAAAHAFLAADDVPLKPPSHEDKRMHARKDRPAINPADFTWASKFA